MQSLASPHIHFDRHTTPLVLVYTYICFTLHIWLTGHKIFTFFFYKSFGKHVRSSSLYLASERSVTSNVITKQWQKYLIFKNTLTDEMFCCLKHPLIQLVHHGFRPFSSEFPFSFAGDAQHWMAGRPDDSSIWLDVRSQIPGKIIKNAKCCELFKVQFVSSTILCSCIIHL